MIRWKDGEVDRDELVQRGGTVTAEALADALDVAVAALKWYADPVAYSMPVRDMNHHVFPDMGTTAKKALRQIGVEQ